MTRAETEARKELEKVKRERRREELFPLPPSTLEEELARQDRIALRRKREQEAAAVAGYDPDEARQRLHQRVAVTIKGRTA